MAANVLAMDPSRTSSIRNKFAADVARRFNALGRDLNALVLKEDAFGLTLNNRWAFETNEDKLRSFRGWLRYQTAQGILGTDADQPARPWTADYVYSAYQRGLNRAHQDATKGEATPRERERLEIQLTTGAQSLERLRMLYLRSFEDLEGVTHQMSIQMSKILASGLVQGTGPRELARQLQEQVGFSRVRAERIARTECLPAETLVDGAVVRAAFRRWYDGPMVEVVTRGARRFTATPNHPMLTCDGWVGAGSLQQGDYLVCDARKHNFGSSGYKNVEGRPATIGEVFDAVCAVGVYERVRCGYPDFHGDGMDSDVDAFSINRHLSFGRFTPFSEPLANDFFTPSGFAASRFCHFCGGLIAVNQSVCFCSRSQIDASVGQASMNQSGVGTDLFGNAVDGVTGLVQGNNYVGRDIGSVAVLDPPASPRIALGLCVGSHHPSTPDHFCYPTRVAPHLGGDLCQGQPAGIQLDRVESLTFRSFSGHVFNLSTPFGYFNIAGGLWTGNTIAAHAQGQLDSFEALGVDGVGAKAEWSTAADHRVCARCHAMEGKVFTLKEAQGRIPLHPLCRCVWLPVVFDDEPQEQRKQSIRKAVRRSAKAIA